MVETGQGLGMAAQHLQDIGAVEDGLVIARPECQRRVQRLERLGATALLGAHNPQIFQGSDVARIGRRGAGIERLGVGQVSAAMQRQGLVQQGFAIHVPPLRAAWYLWANSEKQWGQGK
jgi:hypothetical protein